MRRITPEDIKLHGVVNAPDKLQGTAHENKMIFDRLIREVVAGAINAVIDRFEEFQGVEQIRDQAEKDRQEAEAARQEAEDLRQNTFRQEVEEARGYKEEAEEAANRVGNTADDSEAWAVGQRNGVDVSSLDPAYRNNAKFYKDQAKAIVGGDDVFVFHSIVVPQELWTASLQHEDFPWEATVAAKDVTEQHVPFVVFDHVDAATYGLATVADTGEGTLTIYSVTKPTATFTIPATVFMAENVIPGKEALRQALEEALQKAVESGVFDGPPGNDGQPGPAGADGVSPVATVEAITGGHRVTITDAEGSKSFDVMNGKDGSGTGGGSGGGVSKASELDNDVPFVSAGDAQTLTDAQKKQARVNIGAATVEIEYQNIGSASFVLFDITDGNGESHHLQWSKDPAKPKDGGVWVPQFNEETSMLEWDYYQADALYPVPMPTPVGIPIPDKTSDLENDSEFVELPTMQQSIQQVYDTTNVFIPQNPTEAQKAQARDNIGVENVLESVGGDTLTWDGNTEGLVSVADSFYKVSDAVPTEGELGAECVIWLIDGTQYSPATFLGMGSGVLADDGFGVVIVPDSGVNVDLDGMTFPEKGVYFAVGVSDLTIPGYTGFAKKKIKEEYIPDSVPQVQTAAVGQTIVVSEVDEDGKPTKWEARDAGGGGAEVNLADYGISNDGTNAAATTAGINQALADAKNNGQKSVVFPFGEYLVQADSQIVVDGVSVDFNGSTIRKESNALESYAIVQMEGDGAEVKNAVIYGDRETHDYSNGKTHEWGIAIDIRPECKFATVKNVKVFDTTGYGVCLRSANGLYGSYRSISAGQYNKTTGALESSTEYTVLNDTFDISQMTSNILALTGDGYSVTGIEEPLYYYMTFYDASGSFLGYSSPYRFYDYVDISAIRYNFPALQQIKFTLKNSDVTTTPKILIRSAKTADFVSIQNVEIGRCRTLGIAITGGKYVELKNVEIYNIGGASPGYAVDIEDGYKVNQRIKMDSCYFHDNRIGDITVSGAREVLVNNSTLQASVDYKDGAVSAHQSIDMNSTTTATNFVVTDCNIIGGAAGSKDMTFRNCNLIDCINVYGIFEGCNILGSKIGSLGGIKCIDCIIEDCSVLARDGDFVLDSCIIRGLNDQASFAYISQGVGSKVISVRNCKFYDSIGLNVGNTYPAELIECVGNYFEQTKAADLNVCFGVSGTTKKKTIIIKDNVVNTAGRHSGFTINDTNGSEVVVEGNAIYATATGQPYDKVVVKCTGNAVIRNNVFEINRFNGATTAVLSVSNCAKLLLMGNSFKVAGQGLGAKFDNITQCISNGNVYDTGKVTLPEGTVGNDIVLV